MDRDLERRGTVLAGRYRDGAAVDAAGQRHEDGRHVRRHQPRTRSAAPAGVSRRGARLPHRHRHGLAGECMGAHAGRDGQLAAGAGSRRRGAGRAGARGRFRGRALGRHARHARRLGIAVGGVGFLDHIVAVLPATVRARPVCDRAGTGGAPPSPRSGARRGTGERLCGGAHGDAVGPAATALPVQFTACDQRADRRQSQAGGHHARAPR